MFIFVVPTYLHPQVYFKAKKPNQKLEGIATNYSRQILHKPFGKQIYTSTLKRQLLDINYNINCNLPDFTLKMRAR